MLSSRSPLWARLELLCQYSQYGCIGFLTTILPYIALQDLKCGLHDKATWYCWAVLKKNTYALKTIVPTKLCEISVVGTFKFRLIKFIRQFNSCNCKQIYTHMCVMKS